MMDDKEFQRLSNKDKANFLGLSEYDDGKTEWRVGEQVWFKPLRSRKWRQGRVTMSQRRQSRGASGYHYDFMRVDWEHTRNISRTPPPGMCEHGYEPPLFKGRPHPCSRCRREQFKREIVTACPLADNL